MRQNADIHTRSPNVSQEPRNGNCTEPSCSMGAVCRPTGILSCNHTSAAAPLTDSIKIMQPTHTLLYWKTRCVGGVGWQVYWNETRGRKLLDSLLSSKETYLSHWRTLWAIPQYIVMWMQFHSCLWWRNAAPPKGITWLLECMDPWQWVTWMVRWSSAASFSHDQHTYTQLLQPSKGESEGKSCLRINDLFVHFLCWLGWR